MLSIGFHGNQGKIASLPGLHKEDEEDDVYWIDWHLGQENPIASILYNLTAMCDLFVIHVDGHELDLIRLHIQNLPVSNGRTVLFYGDFARMIAGNLPPPSAAGHW